MTKKQLIKVEGRDLIISNVEKVYFPGNGFTKGEVIAFYSAIAERSLPHRQPLSVWYPTGRRHPAPGLLFLQPLLPPPRFSQ